MAIREATTSVEDPMPAEPRPDRRRRRRDLRAGPFPTVAMEQWHDTESALAKLYRYAEGRAIEATDWYLQDKRGKRIWSRGLRLLAILLVTAGALQPLLDAAAPGPSRTAWGYVLLALAAACIGFDRFFGLSSGWMRSMTTAQSLERRRSSSSTTGRPSVPAAPPGPSTPSRSRTGWPCCGPSPTTWPLCSSRRRPNGCSSSRATCCASSAPTAAVPGRYHCPAPPSPRRPEPCPPITDPSWRRCASGSPTRRSSFDLAGKEQELAGLREQAAAPNLWDDPERARRVMRRLAAVEGDLDTVARLQGALEDLETLNQLALEEDDDSVATELTQGLATLAAAVEDLEVLALLGGEFDDRDAIVTIHPGAGGTESQDWAEMLWRMLARWAERRGFKVTVNDYQEGDEAGIKSVTLTLEGPRAYGLVSAETGTHRLVRISPYDQAKRRHTSFAAVDAIPVLEDEDTPEIDDADLRIDIYRSSGPGGQGVNTTDSAVRITHLPTGIVVAVQNERSQLANKTIALKILAARLAERARKEREAQLAALRGERQDIAFGSQIRSYVLHPYQMVKDHRTNVETGNVQAVLDGDLDQFVAAELRRRATTP
jgi:peptide chain release factor 2